MATVEGTRRFLERAVARGTLHPSNIRVLGSSQLSCASLGFGAYRVGGGEHANKHAEALRAAFRTGINLVDTSTHYSAGDGKGAGLHGASEKLIGRVLSEALGAGEVSRDEVVLCTKLGHVARGSPSVPESVPVSMDGGDDWHCIHPEFVEAEVHASRERLGASPDFVYLHNPEYFLTSRLTNRVPIGDAWDEMYERLARAFQVLERLCDEGVVNVGYGVSGNFLSCIFSTTGRSNLYESLTVDRVVDAAETAAAACARERSAHRLRLLQLPFNLLESGAVIGRGGAVPEAREGDLAVAGRAGLAVLTNRPLNAIPIPGTQSGDWGRNASHLQLRDKKPIGTTEALLKRMFSQEFSSEASLHEQSLQHIALQLANSAPGNSCCLNGMRTEGYVADAAAVLRTAPLPSAGVAPALESVRAALEEMGAERRGLW